METKLRSPVQRSDGVTTAERYLKKLCDRSFLSLWSYPGVYRDQGRSGSTGDGKEICDLLGVFQEHIIIFSDKDCVFPSSGNIELDWKRWFRRAIEKSARQVWGAERWIKSHPNRLFLDRACTKSFPIELPEPAKALFHRIVVAHDGARKCREQLGGSGSLMIAPDVVGAKHCAGFDEGGRPFTVGQIDPAKGYVHVFDDTSLRIVMQTLDTVTDFVAYLTKKERFILSGRLSMATGEEELLALYLQKLNAAHEHDFIVPADVDFVGIDEGHWAEFVRSDQRRVQLEANRVSYAWDAMIEKFNHHILADTQYYQSHPGVTNQEKVIRFLAREPRTRRRMLAEMLIELVRETPRDMKWTRVIAPSRAGDPYYVFLILPPRRDKSESEYREVRMNLLESYCLVTKLKFPDAEDIVGIATEAGLESERSEDALHLDARTWSNELQAEAQRLHDELGLLRETKRFASTVYEYPKVVRPPSTLQMQKSSLPMKGRDRNDPCPCGSGRKFKTCCGFK